MHRVSKLYKKLGYFIIKITVFHNIILYDLDKLNKKLELSPLIQIKLSLYCKYFCNYFVCFRFYDVVIHG